MRLSGFAGLLYVFAVCAAQDAGPNSPTSPPQMVTTAYVPPAPVLRLRTTWQHVFPSEKVKLDCSVDGSSDFTFNWFRDGNQLAAGPDLSFSKDSSVLTVTASAQHAGGYSCVGLHTTGVSTGQSNRLELSVYGETPKPKVSRLSYFNPLYTGDKIVLVCNIKDFDGWEYLWFHHGKEIRGFNKTFQIASVDQSHNGQYHCKAKRGEEPFYTQDSETTSLQVSDPPTPSLERRTPWPDVFEGEPVDFRCDVDDDEAWTFTWYRNGVRLQQDDVLEVDEYEGSLNITSASRRDQGEYSCRLEMASRGVTSGKSSSSKLIVYDNVPKPTLVKEPGHNPMFVGETVNFTCGVSVSSGWQYQWYKDGVKLGHTDANISIDLGSSDGGRYSCRAARGAKILTSPSDETELDILEIPVPSLKRVTKWEKVFPTESVKFRCGIESGSGWKYKWYKDAKQIQAGAAVSFDSDGATLSIQSASASDKGQYVCEGHLPNREVSSKLSSQLQLMIHDKKPSVKVIQDPEYAVMFSGELLTFTCRIEVPSEWDYVWYKDDTPVVASGDKYSLNLTRSTQSGSYKCQAKRGTSEGFETDSSPAVQLQVKNKKPKPEITQKPDVDKVYTGESVSFHCSIKVSSGWRIVWYKNGASLSHPSKSLAVTNASLLDSGTFMCKGVREKTAFSTEPSDNRSLSISEIPVPVLKRETPWLDVFPTESVKFSCGMQLGRSSWRYEWYRDTVKVPADGQDGATLTISSAAASHRGKYRCFGKLKSRSVTSSFSSELPLEVYDKKPVITLLQNPTHSLMHTDDPVSLYCHVNVSTGWDYVWDKDGKQLPTPGSYHNITSAVTTNGGSYKCRVKRGKSERFESVWSATVKFSVEERPQATIVLLTGWSQVFSTDSLMLKCEVTGGQDKWNYTWFKEKQPLESPLSEEYAVTPQNDPEQSLYTCQGIRNGRPSYSKVSDPFETKKLLLKRRVLLTISGIIFFGIIFVFLGCIFLRVFRKQVVEEKKTEPDDLFSPSYPLQGFSDSPLVEYITEASLNAPPKEPEENGVICSETTPLPITSLDESALTSDSLDKEEDNGGLSSFQH